MKQSIFEFIEKAILEFEAGDYRQWECAWGPRMGASRPFLKSEGFGGDTTPLTDNQLHMWKMGSVDIGDARGWLALSK